MCRFRTNVSICDIWVRCIFLFGNCFINFALIIQNVVATCLRNESEMNVEFKLLKLWLDRKA